MAHGWLKGPLTNCALKFHCMHSYLIRIGVEIVWHNVDCWNEWMDGSWDTYLASPAVCFAGAEDITKEREPGIEIIERPP